MYHGTVIDLMGINDVKMAHATQTRVGIMGHAAFDVPTFYREAPDILLASGELCALNRPQIRLLNDWAAGVLKGVGWAARFRDLYAVTISHPFLSRQGLGLCEWASRSFLQQATSRPFLAPVRESH